MTKRKDTTAAADRAVAVADMIERLALAACGAKLWLNPYARDYHRAAVRRMLDALTARDRDLIYDLERVEG